MIRKILGIIIEVIIALYVAEILTGFLPLVWQYKTDVFSNLQSLWFNLKQPIAISKTYFTAKNPIYIVLLIIIVIRSLFRLL